jgi:hypothetical protein
VLEGAFGVQTPFVRTPKFSVEGSRGDWKRKKYRVKVGFVSLIELTLGVYFTLVNLYAWNLGIYGVIPFLCLFQFGFLYMGIASVAQGLKHFTMPNPLARLHSLRARPTVD